MLPDYDGYHHIHSFIFLCRRGKKLLFVIAPEVCVPLFTNSDRVLFERDFLCFCFFPFHLFLLNRSLRNFKNEKYYFCLGRVCFLNLFRFSFFEHIFTCSREKTRRRGETREKTPSSRTAPTVIFVQTTLTISAHAHTPVFRAEK